MSVELDLKSREDSTASAPGGKERRHRLDEKMRGAFASTVDRRYGSYDDDFVLCATEIRGELEEEQWRRFSAVCLWRLLRELDVLSALFHSSFCLPAVLT